MKRYLLLISLLTSLLTLQAQETYQSVFGERETSYTIVFKESFYFTDTDSLYYEKDTIANDKEYKIFSLAENPMYEGRKERYLLRTTEDHSQVYCKRISSNIGHPRDTTQEYLTMDLNLNEQDTFVIYYAYDREYLSDTITVKSVYWDDDGLKHIVFDYEVVNYPVGDVAFEFIEGIGSNCGLFYQGLFSSMRYETGLLCVFKDGQTVYKGTDEIEGCSIFEEGANITEVDEGQVSLYPNPVRTSFTINFEDAPLQMCHIDIFNLQGQCVKSIPLSQSKQEIDVGGFANGVYLVRLLTEQGENVYKKLIIVK